MKTHKELFNEFCTMTDDMLVCYEDNVINILAEHDKEWGEKIKDLLKQQRDEIKEALRKEGYGSYGIQEIIEGVAK